MPRKSPSPFLIVSLACPFSAGRTGQTPAICLESVARGTVENQSEIVVEYQLQPNDVYTPFQASRENIIRWVLAVALCGAFYLGYPDLSEMAHSTENSEAVMAIVVALTVFILLALVVFPYLRVRARFRNSARLHETIHYELRNQGIHFVCEHVTSESKWSLFVSARETNTKFALGSSDFRALYIPKRCLTPENTKLLRQMIRENVKGKIELRAD